MSNRRAEIRMNDDEVAAFLAAPRTMTVATLRAGGHPHLVAMWYGFLFAPTGAGADSHVALWTYAKSQKVVNLRRDPRITCLVADGDRYDELRGVQLAGTATILETPEVVVEVGASIHRRYQGSEISREVRDELEAMARKRVAVRVDVDDVLSWDHRKLS